jgi:hypothetical protein
MVTFFVTAYSLIFFWSTVSDVFVNPNSFALASAVECEPFDIFTSPAAPPLFVVEGPVSFPV